MAHALDQLRQFANLDLDRTARTGSPEVWWPGWWDVPVIGLPTSVGYGLGGGGMGALTSMLQTCAPGLAVVNIDNGIGAGAMAGLIAARAGMARRERNV